MAGTPTSARPSALNQPIPAEVDPLEEIAASQAGPGPAMPASGGEADPLEQYAAAPEATAPGSVGPGGAYGYAAQKMGQALDYGGGLVRTAAADAVGALSGQPDVVTKEDYKKAVKGKAPMSEEFLRRMGVSEGFSIPVPFGKGRVTGRDIEGLALDIGTDPLTLVTKLIKGAPYIGKLINAPGAASEAVGKVLYNNALKKVDQEVVKRGGEAVSKQLLEDGVTGSTKQIAQKVAEKSELMSNIRQGLYDKVNAAKAVVNVEEAPFKYARGVLTKMRENPNMRATANELEEMITNFQAQKHAPIDVVSDWKTSLYDTLPEKAFTAGEGGTRKITQLAQKFKVALAGDLRHMIIQTGEGVEKGLGKSINEVNEKWGSLLSATRPLEKQAASGGIKSWIDWIDATILGSGHVNAAVAKKAFQLANTPYAKTKVGKALVDAGREGFYGVRANDLARRAAVAHGQAQVPPEEKPE